MFPRQRDSGREKEPCGHADGFLVHPDHRLGFYWNSLRHDWKVLVTQNGCSALQVCALRAERGGGGRARGEQGQRPEPDALPTTPQLCGPGPVVLSGASDGPSVKWEWQGPQRLVHQFCQWSS